MSIEARNQMLNEVYLKKDTQMKIAMKYEYSQGYISQISNRFKNLKFKPKIIDNHLTCLFCNSKSNLIFYTNPTEKHSVGLICLSCQDTLDKLKETSTNEYIDYFDIKKRPERYSKEWLSQEEAKLLFSHPDINMRDLLLMRVTYFGAFRINESLSSKFEDYRFEDDYSFMILREQKTDKRNWEKQPIPLHIYSEVKRFCQERQIRFQDKVFQSRVSDSLSYDRAYQIFKESAEIAGINKEITTHTLRRSRLTHLFDLGYDIFFVKEFARHQSIDTTRKYLKLSKKQLANQMDEIDKKSIFRQL